jgi:hypothetical protein
VLACAWYFLLPQPALADPLDSFGFGARAGGMAGALTADASGEAAAAYNPAGVARSSDVEAAVGYGYGITRLTIDGRDAGVTTPRGTSLGLSIPFAVGRTTIAFGIAMYIPDQFLVRVQAIPASEPRFVLLDNDVDRIVVSPVLAVRPLRWLSLGVGATLLADAAGNGVNFDVGVVGGSKVGSAGLDVSLPIRAAPLAGVTVEPRTWLRFGLAYRGAIDLRVKLDILSHVDIANGAVLGDVLISLRAVNLYTPQRLSLGFAVDVLPSLTLAADLAWVNWAGFEGGVPDLRTLIALGVTPSLVQALFPDERFRDVWVPRFGLEYRRAVASRVTLAGRIGYAYERSPVPDQVGLTSFADNDSHLVSVGAGVALERLTAVLKKPLRFDVAIGWRELVGRTTLKDPRVLPGSGFSSGGRIVHLAATLEARF